MTIDAEIRAKRLENMGWICQGGRWVHPLMPARTFSQTAAIEVTRRAIELDTSNQAKPWLPTAKDIEWQEAEFARFNEGGLWAVPGTSSTFQVFPTDRVLVCCDGDFLLENNRRIIAVALAMGWSVKYRDKQKGDRT